MQFKILDYEPQEEVGGPYSIRWWYDRFTKMWVVQVFNASGDEVDSHYCMKYELQSYINDFKEQYNTDDARKYKPGE